MWRGPSQLLGRLPRGLAFADLQDRVVQGEPIETLVEWKAPIDVKLPTPTRAQAVPALESCGVPEAL